jgi:hypothetical protein
VTLSSTDKAAVNQIVNKNGTSSTGATTYHLAAADDWNTVIGNTDISDATGNGITVSNVSTPAITSATYDAATGALVITGSGFLKLNGATNDIDASKFTFTGEGGAPHTLTDSSRCRNYLRHGIHRNAEQHRQSRNQSDRQQKRHQFYQRHHLQPGGCGRLGSGREQRRHRR